MNNIIKEVLKDIGLPNYFIEREEGIDECIVYNYISKPSYYADNKLKGTNFTILINLYCKSNVEANKRNLLKTMRNNGFKGGNVKTTMLEGEINGEKIYNTPIIFEYYIAEK
ncbi:MAG: hypothetical protein KH333_09875 [Clostridium sp.]|nr:hypothetical protein [Clostridium sp.]